MPTLSARLDLLVARLEQVALPDDLRLTLEEAAMVIAEAPPKKETPEAHHKRTGKCPPGYYWDGEDSCLMKENDDDPDERKPSPKAVDFGKKARPAPVHFSKKDEKAHRKELVEEYERSERKKKPTAEQAAKKQKSDALKKGLDRAKARHAHRQKTRASTEVEASDHNYTFLTMFYGACVATAPRGVSLMRELSGGWEVAFGGKSLYATPWWEGLDDVVVFETPDGPAPVEDAPLSMSLCRRNMATGARLYWREVMRVFDLM